MLDTDRAKLVSAGVGVSSRPFPTLLPGESWTRSFVTDLRSITRAVRRVRVLGVLLGVVGLALVFLAFLPGAISGETQPTAVAILFFAGLGLLVAARPVGQTPTGLGEMRLPDVVYVTTQRVIVDQGKEFASVQGAQLEAVRDVVLWQTRTMRRAGLAWAYIVPFGASQIEVRVQGESTPAPGVLLARNLSSRDAADLRTLLLRGASPALGPLPQ